MIIGRVWAWPWSVRGPITLAAFLSRLAWLCVLPMVAVAVYLAYSYLASSNSERKREAADRIVNVATVIDTHLASRITSLKLLASSPHASDFGDLASLYDEAQRFRAGFDGHIIVADTTMQMIINTRVPLGAKLPRLPVSKGRSAAPLALATGKPVVGDIVQGPVANVPLVALAVPIIRNDRVVGLVLGTIEMPHFQSHFDAVALPQSWFLELIDGAGQVMASRGALTEAEPSDDDLRQVTALTNAPWTVALTVPAAVNRKAVLGSAGALLATILVAALVSMMGGRRAGRRLERAMSTLTSFDDASPPSSGVIAEIEAIRARLRDAAQSLRTSEERFRDLFMSNPHTMWVWDLETLAIVAVNDAAVANYGYSRTEWLAMTLKDFRPAEDVPRLLKEVAGVTDGVDNIDIWRHRKKDGTLIDAEVVWHPVTFHGRRCELALSTDVTARLRAEDMIKEYVSRLESAVMGTVNAVSRMLELRDPYTAGHQVRVGELAAEIAREMGLDETMQQGLRIAGRMHDIGKIVVPAEILSMPRRLNDVEYRMVQVHAEQGYSILKDIDFPWPVADVAYQHHERIDGSGYPQGLKGNEISLAARITAVADVVESMASHRPYRPALGPDKALEEIERGRGRLYDPGAVDACLRLFREKAYRLPG